VPRGKYALDFYKTYVRFHGRTQDFKIQYKDISYIEFQRCGQHAGGISKSFDIEVVRKETGPEQFKNIDKLEYPVLIKYFQKSGLKMR